ncbi:MAG: hypothetical protein IIX70_07925 [Oscillospiraceae bacterium]|nr:hypothetical protein [Oscillospiraceae bacterium]
MKRKNNRNAFSVGIIGSAGGPVSIYLAKNKNADKIREERQAFFKRAQTLARPCEKSLDEVILYLVEQFRAKPVELSEGEKTSIKINILLNHYPDLIHREPMPENPTMEQLRQWQERDRSFEEARNYPIELLDLVMEGYEIPEEIAAPLRRQDLAEREKDRPRRSVTDCLNRLAALWRGKDPAPAAPQPITLSLERNHNYMVIRGLGGGALSDELTVFRGISAQDIQNKTPQFMVYADVMRKRGIWK